MTFSLLLILELIEELLDEELDEEFELLDEEFEELELLDVLELVTLLDEELELLDEELEELELLDELELLEKDSELELLAELEPLDVLELLEEVLLPFKIELIPSIISEGNSKEQLLNTNNVDNTKPNLFFIISLLFAY